MMDDQFEGIFGDFTGVTLSSMVVDMGGGYMKVLT